MSVCPEHKKKRLLHPGYAGRPDRMSAKKSVRSTTMNFPLIANLRLLAHLFLKLNFPP